MECEQRLNWLILAMMFPLIAGAPSSMSKRHESCPEENLSITGGSFVLSNGYSDGSFLRYICPNGYYPSVQSRRCKYGLWTPKTSTRKPPECKKVTCPNPRVLENGEVTPYKDRYYVNDTTTYSCNSDYKFCGSAVRVCKPNGKWSGSTPICGRDSDHCPDPGVPPGSSRTGHMFNIDDKVTYVCDSALTLIGSKERVCQDNGRWSGTEPECYAHFTYDTPEEASEAFSSALKSNLELSQQYEEEDQQGKKITQGGKLDIYIAVDSSDITNKDDFDKAKNTIKKLIETISYYQVSPNYEILMFASDVYRISSIRDFKSKRNLTQVFEELDNINFEHYTDGTGTNIAKLYSAILGSMELEDLNDTKGFLETQNIIIVFTDGKANMGGNPIHKVNHIKYLVTKNDPKREKKLDLFVLGIGDDVNQENMNGLVSQRDQEKYFFKLSDLDEAQKMFDSMIDAASSNLCSDENLSIRGGSFSISKDGSLVRYSCSEGYYPTIKIRRCNKGRWNPMPKRKPPDCKKVTCPDPHGFENGEVYPYSPRYFVNDTTHYSCHSSYIFRGSATRVCQLNGKWSGSTPVCGRNSDHCPDPGTPAGSTRTGNIFNIDDKVTYHCDRALTLIGSKERVCQDDGQWSGTEPECYADFTYDTPEEASEGFSSSLQSNLVLSQQHEGTDQYGKKIQVQKGGKLDIYIALDVSDSIEEDTFEMAKDVIKTLIEKISYYEVSPNYEILIFATDVHRIVSMRDFKSGQGNNLLHILKRLENYKYESKGDRSGTNIAQTYRKILESMQIEQMTNREDFMQTQHIVIMFTDGQANMGGNPKLPVDQIKNLVIQNNPSREDKLELYVFGMGDDVNAEDINDLKTNRGNEKFFFKLLNFEELKETFDNMIDEGTSVALCGLYRDYDDGFPSHERRQYPWLAKITVTHNNGKISNCMGSLVTSSFILTAAHCFRFGDTPDRITVNIGSTIRGNKVKQYIPHPHYNLHAKQHMGIPEYYEFDVALIQLEKPVIMGIDLRPICIPCTKETSGALRLSEREGTCRKHKDVLLSAETVNAAFMTDRKRSIEKKFIQIKQGKWRDACVEDAKKAEGITATNADDIVTENFLCSGGIEPSRDDIACRGDSGGATFVVPGNRMIQVGIISWGVKDLCARNPSASSDAQSRDYHTSLFSAEVRSFLKDYLGNGTLGTPLTFL